MKQFVRFCIVGALGFVTDFSVLYLAVTWLGMGTLSGRVVSFLVAATVTWKVNRHFTFVKQGRGALHEWLRYVVFTGLGGLINVGVYQAWIWRTDHRTVNLFLAVVAGSAIALLFNFAISKRVVFVEIQPPT